MVRFEAFLDSAVRTGFLNSAVKNTYGYKVSGNGVDLDIHINPLKDKAVLWSSGRVSDLYQVQSDNLGPLLSRVVSQAVVGLGEFLFKQDENTAKYYSNAVIAPIAIESGCVVFQDAAGRQYIKSDTGGDAPEVCLGLYNVLYSTKGEDKILRLPGLFPKDAVKVEQVKSSTGLVVDKKFIFPEQEELNSNSSLPLSQEDGLYIKSSLVPKVGYVEVFGRLTSAASFAGTEQADYALNKFMCEPTKVRAEARPNATFDSIFSSASDVNLKLENGFVYADVHRSFPWHDAYTTFKIKSSIDSILAVLSNEGIGYHSIKSGCSLKSSNTEGLKFFLKQTKAVEPVASKDISPQIYLVTLTSSAIDDELKEFDLATSGIFKKMTILSSGASAEALKAKYHVDVESIQSCGDCGCSKGSAKAKKKGKELVTSDSGSPALEGLDVGGGDGSGSDSSTDIPDDSEVTSNVHVEGNLADGSDLTLSTDGAEGDIPPMDETFEIGLEEEPIPDDLGDLFDEDPFKDESGSDEGLDLDANFDEPSGETSSDSSDSDSDSEEPEGSSEDESEDGSDDE